MGSDSATKAAPALRLIERNRPSATCKGTAAWSLPDVSARGRTGSDSNVVGVHDKFSVGGLDMGTIILDQLNELIGLDAVGIKLIDFGL